MGKDRTHLSHYAFLHFLCTGLHLFFFYYLKMCHLGNVKALKINDNLKEWNA